MNLWVIAAGVLAGLGVFALVRELLPGAVRLDAALRRLDPAAGWMGAPVSLGFADYPAAAPADGQEGDAVRRIGGQLAALAPWLPVPATDLALLGRDRESWLASKLGFGLAGLAIIPLAAVALALNGARIPVALPAFASVLLGVGMFFLPDLSVRLAARGRRADFRHALASYLDLVSLERGAGAGPTEALELAAETGVTELADLADIAEVAGQEGAKILQTLAARAESMRAEALAAERASAGAKSTTMVVPIALLGGGFLILIVFPLIYRMLGSG